MSADGFTTLQDQCAAYLRAHPYFTPVSGKAIEVLAENLGDIENKIAVQIGKLGIVVVLLTPAGPVRNTNDPEPLFIPKLVAGVIEWVTLNRSATGTGERAPKVAMIIGKLLHQNISGGVPFLNCLGIDYDPDTARQVKNGTAYRVSFEVPDAISAPEATRGSTVPTAGLEDGSAEGLESGETAGLEG